MELVLLPCPVWSKQTQHLHSTRSSKEKQCPKITWTSNRQLQAVSRGNKRHHNFRSLSFFHFSVRSDRCFFSCAPGSRQEIPQSYLPRISIPNKPSSCSTNQPANQPTNKQPNEQAKQANQTKPNQTNQQTIKQTMYAYNIYM